MNSSSKTYDKNTKAEDLKGFTTSVAELNYDFANMTLTDLVVNTTTLIKNIVVLIKSCSQRNELLKAVLRRMQSLEPTFVELQKIPSPKLTKEPLTNLLFFVNGIQKLCERIITEKKTVWEKFKDVLASNNDLKELYELNENLTKVLADLQIPFEIEKFDKVLEYLGKIYQRTEEIIKENLNNKIPSYSKQCLTNEEAFSFWIRNTFKIILYHIHFLLIILNNYKEFIPEKSYLPVNEFRFIFKEYIKQSNGAELKNQDFDNILKMIKLNSEDQDMINAKEVNAFFEKIPFDVQWHQLKNLEKKIQIENDERTAEAENKRKETICEVKNHAKNIELKETAEEKRMKNENFTRFFVNEAWIKIDKKRIGMNFRNIFIKAEVGEILGYGSDIFGEFQLIGNINKKGEFSVEISHVKGKKQRVLGKLILGEKGIYFDGETDNVKLRIQLDVKNWFGYFMEDKTSFDMNTYFTNIDQTQIVGISYNNKEMHLTVWSGIMTETEIHVIQNGICQDYHVSYEGKVKINGPFTEMKGKWTNQKKNQIGIFYLSHEDHVDYNDDNDVDDDNDNKLCCEKKHKLKWDNTDYIPLLKTKFTCNGCKFKGIYSLEIAFILLFFLQKAINAI